MKKSLLIVLPIAAMALVGCRGGRGEPTATEPGPTSITPTTEPTTVPTTQPTTEPTSATRPSSPITDTATATHPVSPWPAVEEGNGTLSSPWNVTQAWEYVDKNLPITYATSGQEQYQSPEEYSVKGYVCYVETVSDGRDPNHPHSVKFHMADANHHVTEDEVMTKSEFVRNGFCVYFADTNPALPTEEAAWAIQGKLVVVTGHLLNWGFEPEVTKDAVFSILS